MATSEGSGRDASSSAVTSQPTSPAAATGDVFDAGADWPRQATESIVRMVDTVRAKTTGPALSAATIAAYGLTLTILALPLTILILLVLMRATERLFIAVGLDDPIWLVYLLYGSLFCLAGLTLWARRTRPASETSS